MHGSLFNTPSFYQIEPQKRNGASPILPINLSRDSKEPKAKIFFLFLLGILDSLTSRAQPCRPILKHCQNGIFKPCMKFENFWAECLHLNFEVL